MILLNVFLKWLNSSRDYYVCIFSKQSGCVYIRWCFMLLECEIRISIICMTNQILIRCASISVIVVERKIPKKYHCMIRNMNIIILITKPQLREVIISIITKQHIYIYIDVCLRNDELQQFDNNEWLERVKKHVFVRLFPR